jgi:MFS family permease
MLPLKLFRRRNFAVANAQTLVIYGGIAILGFFVTIYLQEVAGYSALKSGVTGLVPTAVMFVLSARMGRLADRYGPRPFLVVGPLLVAAGFGLMQRYGTSVSLWLDVLPALLVFSLGLSMTVAPLTATVLADADESEAGIASAVNNAIARTAALIAVAGVGAVVSAFYAKELDKSVAGRLPASSQPALLEAKRRTFGIVNPSAIPPAQRPYIKHAAATASEDAFHLAVGVAAGLLVVAGIGGLALRSERESDVQAAGCPGGQLAGQPLAAADCQPVVVGAAAS